MANVHFSFASDLNKSSFGKSLAPIASIIEQPGEAFQVQSNSKNIYTTVNSNSWGDQFTSYTTMDGFKPGGENEAPPVDGFRESYSKIVETVEWRDEFTITYKAFKDNIVHKFTDRPTQFITGYHRTREQFGMGHLGSAMRGDSSFNFCGYKFANTTADKKALFATDHPSILGKASQSNKFADSFSAAVLTEAETRMQNIKGDNNNYLDISPDTIIIPNIGSIKHDVFAAIGADKDPTSNNNAFSFQYGRWTVIWSQYLCDYVSGDTIPWMLFDSKANQRYKNLVWVEREPLSVEVYKDNKTRSVNFNGYARFTTDFIDWRSIAVGGVSGGTQLITT